MNKYSVSSHKSFPQPFDGEACSGQLLKNGKKVCEYSDDGNGGPMNLYWEANERQEFIQACKDAGIASEFDTMIEELGICRLIDKYNVDKQLRRWCGRETLFRLPDDEAGSYRTVKAKYSEDVKKYIMGKYPTAEIINQRFM